MPEFTKSYLPEPFIAESSTSVPFTPESFTYKCDNTCSICNTTVVMSNIIRKSQDVFINTEKLRHAAKQMVNHIVTHYENFNSYQLITTYVRHKLKSYPTLIDYDNKTLDWLFVLNALNFSLWHPKNAKQWTVDGQTGFIALSIAIKRAIDEGKPIWCPTYYSKITSREFRTIFRSDDNETTIPLIYERVRVLHEIGRVLLDKFQGTFVNCIEYCKGDGFKLMHLLLEEFESYRDLNYFEGNEIYIASKIVTLLNDLTYLRKIYVEKKQIVSTMFVDYCSPQILLHLGVLSYSNRLVKRLAENDKPLEYGSREELEIRCNTFHACGLLLNEVMRACVSYLGQIPALRTSNILIIMDNYLWLYRMAKDKELKNNVPYHNITSIYY